MRTVNINNHLWLVDLHWAMIPADKGKRGDLLQKAQSIDPAFDMAVSRGKDQFGFGAHGGSEQVKARALAAFVHLPGSFLGLFCLTDAQDASPCWWVYALNNGAVVGIGDQLFATREAAEDHLTMVRDLLGLGDADNSVDCRTVEESAAWLEPFLQIGAVARFRQQGCPLSLTERRRLSPLAAVCFGTALLGCCIWGGLEWLDYSSREATREANRLGHLNETQRRQEIQAHPEKFFTQKWLDTPQIEDVAIPCIFAMLDLPTVANGWLLNTAACTGNSITISWEYQPGVSDFVSLPEKARLDSRNTKLAVSHLPLLPGMHKTPRVGQEYPHLLARDLVQRLFLQITQTLGAKLRLKFQPAETRTVDKTEIKAPWVAAQWELSQIPPLLLHDPEMFRLLALPSLTLDSLSFKDHAWTAKGRVYAKE